jgi:hypothetical protein
MLAKGFFPSASTPPTLAPKGHPLLPQCTLKCRVSWQYVILPCGPGFLPCHLQASCSGDTCLLICASTVSCLLAFCNVYRYICLWGLSCMQTCTPQPHIVLTQHRHLLRAAHMSLKKLHVLTNKPSPPLSTCHIATLQASHEGDFDPTNAILSRRLLRDPVVHGEEDARATLRQLHNERGPECRARIVRRLRPAHGG